MADVIATVGWCVVADVIASGRWKSHQVNLLQFKFWGVNQKLIPNMWQMVFAHISVEGWIIDPYVQSLFYCPNLVQVLPPNNFEVIDGNTVTTDVTVVIYGRGGFQVFLEPFSKSSWGLSNIFLITIHPVTMISVDDSTLFLDWISVFGSHQEVLDSSASPYNAPIPQTFCQCFWCSHWGYYSMVPLYRLLGVVTGSICWCLFSAWIVYFLLNSVESPCGVLAVLKCILQMLFFFMQQLCDGADGICSVLQCSNHTILGS